MNSDKSRPRVLISGWYGHDNTGDEAILQQFIAEMASSGCSVRVLSENPERIDALYGAAGVCGLHHSLIVGPGCLTEFWSGRSRRLIAALRGSDLFVLGGGGLLRDNTSWRNTIRLLDEVWLARLCGVPVALYAVGAGPFRSRIYRWLLKHTIQQCDVVTVREEVSKQQLVSLGAPPDNVQVVADPAFLLEPRPLVENAANAALLEQAGNPAVAGIFLKQFAGLEAVAPALDRLYAERGLRFVAVPLRCHNHGNDDREAARLVRANMRHPEALSLHENRLTAPEIKCVAGKFQFNLAVRLHGLIFSLGMGVPAVAINYEPKVANCLGSFGLERFLVPADSELSGNLADAVLCCLAERSEYAQHLNRVLPEIRRAAEKPFSLFRKLLDSPKACPTRHVELPARL